MSHLFYEINHLFLFNPMMQDKIGKNYYLKSHSVLCYQKKVKRINVKPSAYSPLWTVARGNNG